ncbi:MAG: AAA domain-containing protein [Pseudomonadota bacterium]
MYSTYNEFLTDADALHQAQLTAAQREPTTRFSARAVGSSRHGMVTTVQLWIAPAQLKFLLGRGMESGNGAMFSWKGNLDFIGYFKNVDTSKGIVEISLSNIPLAPFDGDPVHGRISPLEFLIRREEAALREAALRSPERVQRMLCPCSLKSISPGELSEGTSRRLNPSQQAAVQGVVGSPDFSILIGPPGTGKTETIAWAICELRCRRKTVLLTSCQHRAIDECLLRLVKITGCAPEGVLRIGDPAKVHPGLHEMLDRERLQHSGIWLVACTLSVVHSGLLEELGVPAFDRVIMDEAGRATLASAVPALLRASESWTLSGDPEQLAPIVPDEVRGLESAQNPMTYYMNIPEARRERVGVLTESYRFENESIAAGVGAFYRVRGISLTPSPSIIEAEAKCALTFVDTDGHPSVSGRFGKSWSFCNPYEAAVVYTLVHKIACGNGGLNGSVWALTPFRLQRELIRSLFRPKHRDAVASIDQSQGGERPVIILSLVADTTARVLRYLTAGKMNVACSRARSRLVIVGNFKALDAVCLPAKGNSAADPGLAALLETFLDRGRFETVAVAPDLLDKAKARAAWFLDADKRKKQTEELLHKPDESVKRELYRIPRSAFPLLSIAKYMPRRRH